MDEQCSAAAAAGMGLLPGHGPKSITGEWRYRASMSLEMERIAFRRSNKRLPASLSCLVFVTYVNILQSPSHARNFRTAARHNL